MFCVHCGKQFNPQARFCPHCGKPSSGAPSTPVTTSAPQVNPYQAQQNIFAQQPQVPQPQPKQPKERDPESGKKLAIIIGSIAAAALVAGGIWGGIVLFGAADSQKAALAEGLTANCDSAFTPSDVSDAEVQDSRGLKTFSVFVSGGNMDWVLVEETSSEYSFEIDSIYSASAIRAQDEGCELAFTVRR